MMIIVVISHSRWRYL